MNFRERFEAHTNSELFRITDNPGDYQSEAVEAARSIIAERRLTDAEIAAARGELDAEKRERAEQERQGQQRRERRNAAVRRLVDALNPIRSDIPVPGRLVNIVCIVLGVWYLIWFVRVRPVGFLLFTLGDWDWSVLTLAVPLVWVPTAIILFWRRKKAGWFMFSIYAVCSAGMALWSIVSMFGAQTEGVVYIGNAGRHFYIRGVGGDYFRWLAARKGIPLREAYRRIEESDERGRCHRCSD